jgi:hypothetical protein
MQAGQHGSFFGRMGLFLLKLPEKPGDKRRFPKLFIRYVHGIDLVDGYLDKRIFR